MCGRVIQSSGPLNFAIVDGMNVRDSRVHNYPPRWNAAPSQDLLVIRRNHRTGEVSLDPLRWGLIPHWCNDPQGGRKPINAKCETVHTLPTFRDAYRSRRCVIPVDGFFEWMAIKGQKAKQPYAIAMKDGRPFGLGGRGRRPVPVGAEDEVREGARHAPRTRIGNARSSRAFTRRPRPSGRIARRTLWTNPVCTAVIATRTAS
jgi:putative SOS response-associated peptidase YedK